MKVVIAVQLSEGMLFIIYTLLIAPIHTLYRFRGMSLGLGNVAASLQFLGIPVSIFCISPLDTNEERLDWIDSMRNLKLFCAQVKGAAGSAGGANTGKEKGSSNPLFKVDIKHSEMNPVLSPEQQEQLQVLEGVVEALGAIRPVRPKIHVVSNRENNSTSGITLTSLRSLRSDHWGEDGKPHDGDRDGKIHLWEVIHLCMVCVYRFRGGQPGSVPVHPPVH